MTENTLSLCKVTLATHFIENRALCLRFTPAKAQIPCYMMTRTKLGWLHPLREVVITQLCAAVASRKVARVSEPTTVSWQQSDRTIPIALLTLAEYSDYCAD
jgi:hypothetical protein